MKKWAIILVPFFVCRVVACLCKWGTAATAGPPVTSVSSVSFKKLRANHRLLNTRFSRRIVARCWRKARGNWTPLYRSYYMLYLHIRHSVINIWNVKCAVTKVRLGLSRAVFRASGFAICFYDSSSNIFETHPSCVPTRDPPCRLYNASVPACWFYERPTSRFLQAHFFTPLLYCITSSLHVNFTVLFE